MQFAHNGSYKGSIPFGLIFIIVIINLANIIIKEYNKLIYIASPTVGTDPCLAKRKERVLGRVWFMALVLKTSTLIKS